MPSPLETLTGAAPSRPRTRPAGAMFTVKIPLPPGSTGYAASLLNAAGEVVPPPFQQEGDNLVAHPDAWPTAVRILAPGGGDFTIPFTPPASGTEGIVDLSRLGGDGGMESPPLTEVPPAVGRLSTASIPAGWSIQMPAGVAPPGTLVELAPGDYTFTATNRDTGETRAASVTIRAGETAAPPWSAFAAPTPPAEGVGLVTINGITPTMRLWIDGQPVTLDERLPTLRLAPGAHRFKFADTQSMVNGPQSVPVTAEATITVRAGETLTITPNFGPSWDAAFRAWQVEREGSALPWLLGLAAVGGVAWYFLSSQKEAE